MRKVPRPPERTGAGATDKRRAAFATVVLACALGLTACSGSRGCVAGQTTVDSTMHEFLVAAQQGDRAGIEAQVFPSLEVSDSDIEQLRQSLQGVDLDGLLFTSSSELPYLYQVLVADRNGTIVVRYSVGDMVDQQRGCFAVNLGHQRPPAPGEYVTPSSASTLKP